MRRWLPRRLGKLLGPACALLLLAAGLGFWQRHALLTWGYLECAARATDSECAVWVERLADLDVPGVPHLLAALQRHDATACTNVRLALVRLSERWPANDPRQDDLRKSMIDRFPRLSPEGQRNALEWYAVWLNRMPSPAAREGAMALLATAGRSPEAAVRCQALMLANAVLQHGATPEQVSGCRELARQGLQDTEAANRVEAVRVAVHPQVGLARQAAPLLDDPAPAVRQMAIVAVGSTADAVATDDLLRSLHDKDADVRRLCEAALKSRGLKPEEVTLARLITDARATTRLQILNRLGRADLEPGIWLRRLSQDSSPAVRAAAVRAAAEFPEVDFADQMHKMAAHDPSATVRQLAQHYLKQRADKGRRLENR